MCFHSLLISCEEGVRLFLRDFEAAEDEVRFDVAFPEDLDGPFNDSLVAKGLSSKRHWKLFKYLAIDSRDLEFRNRPEIFAGVNTQGGVVEIRKLVVLGEARAPRFEFGEHGCKWGEGDSMQEGRDLLLRVSSRERSCCCCCSELEG